tara:strand:+ start:249 stop:497 length:249 start_codon:yes stop_codon:yes gene_type:complete
MADVILENPVILVHQPDYAGAGYETLIFNRDSDPLGCSHYGILIADIIRHVAQAMNVAESDVSEWVQRELDQSTSEVTRLLS